MPVFTQPKTNNTKQQNTVSIILISRLIYAQAHCFLYQTRPKKQPKTSY
jgi:hypothetical protein